MKFITILDKITISKPSIEIVGHVTMLDLVSTIRSARENRKNLCWN